MILSDREIRKAIASKEIIIDPQPPDDHYTTSAVDLRLGDEFVRPKTPGEIARDEPAGVERPITLDVARIDLKGWLRKYSVQIEKDPDGSIVIEPGQFMLGITHEYIELSRRIAARVEGRSTLARLGLVVHLTAPTVHAGFKGHLILEMCNLGPHNLRLRPGLPICQLIFERLGEEAIGPLRTPYSGQTSPMR